jgi:EAL domain-containing protein (putative c-di-GMP-specific phosphodiesterase class I)
MKKRDVLTAIDQDRLFLLLQPVVSAQTHRPVFHEALLRLRTMEGEVLAAGAFIVSAEEQRFVHTVDRRALELAIQLMERHPAFDLAMNISSLTTADFDWVRTLDELTADRRGLTSRMIVEVTETAAIEDVGRTLLFVDALKDLGCRIAIDDYGAGYTNFSNLVTFAPHIVKIDRSFGSTCVESNSRAFVAAVVELAQRQGFETVAEGIETEDCARVVTDLGVTYMQGFLFGEPSDPDAVLAAAGLK